MNKFEVRFQQVILLFCQRISDWHATKNRVHLFFHKINLSNFLGNVLGTVLKIEHKKCLIFTQCYSIKTINSTKLQSPDCVTLKKIPVKSKNREIIQNS